MHLTRYAKHSFAASEEEGLSARFAPLDEENRLRAVQDLLSFSRRQGETIDALISRFDITRQMAHREGGGAISIETAALILLRACAVTSEQFQTLTQPFGLRLPMSDPESQQMCHHLRRLAHIVERHPNNIASGLRQHSHFSQTYLAEADTGSSHSSEPWLHQPRSGDWSNPGGMGSLNQTDWAFQATVTEGGYSETDSATSSDQDEPIAMDDLQGMTNSQADEYLFGQYQQAKKRWRRFTGKPVRALRRTLHRKGKGKGKRGRTVSLCVAAPAGQRTICVQDALVGATVRLAPPLRTADVQGPSGSLGSTMQQNIAQVQAHQLQSRNPSRSHRGSDSVPSVFMQFSGIAHNTPYQEASQAHAGTMFQQSQVPTFQAAPVAPPYTQLTSMFGQVHALRSEESASRAAARQSIAAGGAEHTDAEEPRRSAFQGFVSSCTVCLEEFSPGDEVCRMRCGHVFHTMCVGELAAQNEIEVDPQGLVRIVCPNCRTTTQVLRAWRYPALSGMHTPPTQESDAQAEPDSGGTPVRDGEGLRDDDEAPEVPTEARVPDAEDPSLDIPSAFPWWPVPEHCCDPPEAVQATAYHSNVRLADGRVGLLVDPGSYGNLVGAQWLEEASRQMPHLPSMTTRAQPLQVGGVGKGAQVCREDCRLPIAMTRQDGSITTGTFSSPVVLQSGCPALLGLKALQDNRAILDLGKKQLHFVGQGEPTLVLPPGSETFQLEAAVSGHLLLPCAARGPASAGEHHLFSESDAAECHLVSPAGERSEHERICQEACACFDPVKAMQVVVDIACKLHQGEGTSSSQRFEGSQGLSLCFGAYTYGGKQGITKITAERPWLTQLICRTLAHAVPAEEYTSFMLLKDSEAPMHIDKYNHGKNIVLPLKLPPHGGGLWVELRPGDKVSGEVAVHHDGSTHVAGQVFKLQVGVPQTFCPKARHATEPWTRGHRVVIAAYTTGGYARLAAPEARELTSLGFAMPSGSVRQVQEALLAESQSSQDSPVHSKPLQQDQQVHEAAQVESKSSQDWSVHSKSSETRPTGASASSAKHRRSSCMTVIRRVLLISLFHSSASAFLSQGWEPTRFRPLELLRSGFDDAVSRLKQDEYSALWVDLADARHFGGQERTSQICSRLAVLFTWAERQAVPVILAASRRTAWNHPGFKQLVDRGQFYTSHHSWCRLGARISAATSAERHKVLSTIRLPNHDCRCSTEIEHVFDLDDKSPGSAKIRAQAEQTVVASIVAALGRVLDAGQGSPKPSDPVDATSFSTSTTTDFVCATCGLMQAGPGCRFCDADSIRTFSVLSPASPASSSNQEPCKVEPQAPNDCYPTESKLMQRQKQKANKAAGIEPTVQRRHKHVEQHFDDCGEDLSSLSFPVAGNLLDDSDSSGDDAGQIADALVNRQLNAFETWTRCGSTGDQVPAFTPETVVAVDVDEMQSILSSASYTSWGVEIVELFGGQGQTSRLCVRRKLRAGHNFELLTGVNLADPVAQRKVLGYISIAKPLVVVMAPVCSPYGPLGNWNRIINPGAWQQSVGNAEPLAAFSGRVAEVQLTQQRYFLIEQPYPSKLYEVDPWPKVRQHPKCVRVVFHQCMLGQSVQGLLAKKPTELVANHRCLIAAFEGLQCDNSHAHAQLLGGRAHQTQRWPVQMCSKIAHGINILTRKLVHEGALAGNVCKKRATGDAYVAGCVYPSVSAGTDEAGDSQQPESSEAWRGCKGCLWRLHRGDPLHSRVRGVCKYPDDETFIFDCPGCKARKNRLSPLLVSQRLWVLYWIDTRSMLADALTKGSCSRELITAAMSGNLLMPQPYEIQEIRR
ncbi:unnamed protein product [Symbiodinium natans]|uniref:RING-type domain-containing protein n=1 Tax=Symbiodinium natans TaxID=878477 RepID=A0A812M726_9DINO|nr:unnamed protein product [Symbiodinium natans]